MAIPPRPGNIGLRMYLGGPGVRPEVRQKLILTPRVVEKVDSKEVRRRTVLPKKRRARTVK